MILNRVWAMPNRHTFLIKTIAELMKRYDVGKNWIDPFAGENSPAEVTNDLNPNKPTTYHFHALQFCDCMIGPYKGILLDPPYSLRQTKECYESIGLSFIKQHSEESVHFGNVKDAIKDKITEYAISFGWNSTGFGKTRGFEIIEILLVNHGGNGHHDTIVTVEKRTNY